LGWLGPVVRVGAAGWGADSADPCRVGVGLVEDGGEGVDVVGVEDGGL
jgi:hypothetical protein